MRQDKFNNPIFDSQDLFKLIYQGKANVLPDLIVDKDTEIRTLETYLEKTLAEPNSALDQIGVSDFDAAMQSDWFMPDSYKNMDIEAWIYSLGGDNVRVREELEAFKQRNMMDLLRWLKYFVDTCRANNILWGVGRGSSVSSYILFLIGVHKIDSIKYNLDWQEFLR